MSETVTFDHYSVMQRDDGSPFELGRGAMGITYKAFDTNLRIPVALKVINSKFLDSDVARQRFVREARAAAKLRHRHVASVFHLAAEGETMFYAMEFIDGETVDALIKRQGPLAPLLALQIVDQVARALNAAQVHGLVHRDIKPANLMLIREDDELTVKVIDFGLAKTLTPGAEDAATISQGGFVGTPHFASPEQLEEREIDVRSDIYSLGVTLWYMLAGQTPFAGSMAQVMSQHLAKAPPFERLANVPAPVAALLRRMLEKEREARPQTPSELRQEVEKAIAQIRIGGPADPLAAQVNAEDFATVLEDAPTKPGDAAFNIGSVVAGRYKINARLGDTNTGVVFRAERTDDARPVRMLVLHRELTLEPATATQIEREVERAVPVEHPNLLRVFGIEAIEGASFITMEWTEGFSLLEVLRARRELEAVEVLKLLEQAAAGVDHALGAGIKKLDLALHQIFIHFAAPFDKHALLHHPVTQWPEFVLKLNPLGITRDLSASETFSGEQTVVGPPSSSTAASSDGARAMQALGGVVYELLGGTLSPLGSGSDLGSHYTPLANLSEQGNQALRFALAPAPPYKKAGDFHRALAEVDGLPVDIEAPIPVAKTAPRPSTPPPITPPPLPLRSQPSRSGAPLAIAAMLVALILIGGALYLFVIPLFKKPTPDIAQTNDNSADVSASGDSISGTQKPTTAPPKKTDPKTPPPPSRTELLKTASTVAENLENDEKWVPAINEWIKIIHEFPDTEAPKTDLNMMFERLRGRGPEVNAREFPDLRAPTLEAAQLNVVAAMMFLAENVRASDPKEAFAWFSAAAARGQVSALTTIGVMLVNGEGCERDLGKAVDAIRGAAEQGSAVAKTALGEFNVNGTNVPQSNEKAFALFQDAADAGDARGMDWLATCFHQGLGTKVNNAEALRLYTRASELGFARSFANLAVLHLNGDGTKADPFKAVGFLQKGARAGDSRSLFLYANCLENGRGVKSDATLAREIYKKAAEAGSGEAQKWCKDHGLEVPRPISSKLSQ